MTSDSEDIYETRRSTLKSRKMADPEELDEDLIAKSDLLKEVIEMRKKIAMMEGTINKQRIDQENENDGEAEEDDPNETDQDGGDKNSDENSDSEEDPFTTYEEKHRKKEDTGPPVHDKLGGLVMTLLTERMEPEKIEEMCGNMRRPENIPMLQTPRVTEKLWKNLPPKARARDSNLGKLSDSLVNVLTIVTDVANKIEDVRRESDQETRTKLRPVTNTILDALQVKTVIVLHRD